LIFIYSFLISQNLDILILAFYFYALATINAIEPSNYGIIFATTKLKKEVRVDVYKEAVFTVF